MTTDYQASASSAASLHVPHGQGRVHHYSGRRGQEADPAGFQRQDLDPRDAPAGHRQGGQAARRRHGGRNTSWPSAGGPAERGAKVETSNLNVCPAGGVGELPSGHYPHESDSPEQDALPVSAAPGVPGQRPAQTRHPLLPL